MSKISIITVEDYEEYLSVGFFIWTFLKMSKIEYGALEFLENLPPPRNPQGITNVPSFFLTYMRIFHIQNMRFFHHNSGFFSFPKKTQKTPNPKRDFRTLPNVLRRYFTTFSLCYLKTRWN